MGLEVPPLFDDPEAGKATLFEPMELDKDLPDHVPRNASMARELQAICYRRGWYYGYRGACPAAANPADSQGRCMAVRFTRDAPTLLLPTRHPCRLLLHVSA